MTREEALAHFETTYVRPKCLEQLRALAAEYRARRDELAAGFVATFREICLKAGGMQAAGEKGPLGYITCSMLRTALADGLPSHRLAAQDRDWYLDPVACETDYDAAWAFCYLNALEKELEAERRQYMNLIIPPDIDRIKRRAAEKFNRYVVELARYAMGQAVVLPEYQALSRAAEFEVRVGEHRDWTEVVYKEDRRVKDPAEVKEWLEAKEEAAYSYEVFAGLNLADGNYAGVDLSYADLRQTNLDGSNLREADLTGAQCSAAVLRETDLCGAYLWGANFRGADLRGALLFAVEGGVGPLDAADEEGFEEPWDEDEAGDADGSMDEAAEDEIGRDEYADDYEDEWDGPELDGVCFAGADLTGVDFAEADLRGADFRGAKVTGVSFLGVRLDGAFFSKEAAGIVELDDEQREVVIWE